MRVVKVKAGCRRVAKIALFIDVVYDANERKTMFTK